MERHRGPRFDAWSQGHVYQPVNDLARKGDSHTGRTRKPQYGMRPNAKKLMKRTDGYQYEVLLPDLYGPKKDSASEPPRMTYDVDTGFPSDLW
jgi:hypothetical protein